MSQLKMLGWIGQVLSHRHVSLMPDRLDLNNHSLVYEFN